MFAFLPGFFRLIWLFTSGHQALVLENLALRQQLAVYKRKKGRPRLATSDRWFWMALAGVWRAPRIHGELLKLGIKVSERTISRILQTVHRPPSQSWKAFLQNHVGEIVATDFFTVPTVTLRVLFVFLVIEHQRRKIIYFGVIEHPTAEWVGQQMVEACADRDGPRYLVRDRDAAYGNEFRCRIQSLGIRDVVTAPRSPWQNAFVERVIGSIRRECLNHIVVLNQRHLRKLLKNYLAYYHRTRTHLALAKDAPEPRAAMRQGKIISIPQVGGLHHRYERHAA